MNVSNLKTLRKNAKLSQEELAEKLHVTRQTVAKWEAGESLPDIDSCIIMSKLYDITIDDLVMFAKNPSSTRSPKGKHIFGLVTVGERGQIVIPKDARELFAINPGDKLLVMGDEKQGIAIVKADAFQSFASFILEAMKKKGEL